MVSSRVFYHPHHDSRCKIPRSNAGTNAGKTRDPGQTALLQLVKTAATTTSEDTLCSGDSYTRCLHRCATHVLGADFRASNGGHRDFSNLQNGRHGDTPRTLELRMGDPGGTPGPRDTPRTLELGMGDTPISQTLTSARWSAPSWLLPTVNQKCN